MGVEKDKSRAVQCFESAAQKNYSFSYVTLGKLYLEGDGVEKDRERGLNCIKLAANLGNKDAIKIIQLYEFLSNDAN